jgi:hypothetical protein
MACRKGLKLLNPFWQISSYTFKCFLADGIKKIAGNKPLWARSLQKKAIN